MILANATIHDSRSRGAWLCPLLNHISLPLPIPPSLSPFAFAFAVAMSRAHPRERAPVIATPSSLAHIDFPPYLCRNTRTVPFLVSHPPPTGNRPRQLVASVCAKVEIEVDCRGSHTVSYALHGESGIGSGHSVPVSVVVCARVRTSFGGN